MAVIASFFVAFVLTTLHYPSYVCLILLKVDELFVPFCCFLLDSKSVTDLAGLRGSNDSHNLELAQMIQPS